MNGRKNFEENEFEGSIKITNFPSKEKIIEKINLYLEKYKKEEKETSTSLLLNFHKNTEMANYVIRKLKLLQMENQNYSKINCHLAIKVINQREKNEKNDEGKNEKSNKTKKNNYNVYNIDTKNNPRLNKLLDKSLNFNKRNINKYLSPDNNKMKIYESIFLNGGPYIERNDIAKEEARKNKAQWLNKKGFIPYIGKETILKNSHMIENYLSKEPAQSNNFQFREIQKSKWVGKNNFFV